MRTEPELRAMIRSLDEEAENTDREMKDALALDDPSRGAPANYLVTQPLFLTVNRA